MPKIPDYGHPVVRLEITHEGPLMIRVVDDKTGEELMAESIRATGLFLLNRGYTWVPGSNGKWAQS